MKKKLFLILNIFFAAMCYISNYLYITRGGVGLKATASAFFALLGITNLVFALSSKLCGKDLRFPITMAIGLIMGMLGDIFINYNFVIGAGTFGLAHILFLCGYFVLVPFSRSDLITTAVFLVPSISFLMLSPALTFEVPVFKYVCLVYGFVLSSMAGKTLSMFINKRSKITTILVIGSFLFFVSDFMLLLNWFMNLGRYAAVLCLATYYPAECMLAHSSFAYTLDKTK